MVLGFEMFPRRVQPVLDRWSKGELNEADFLREVDWPQIWGFADELYLPLFHFARMHRLPMLALNIDRATNRRVAAQGLASVPSTEREGVGDPAPASSSYRDRLFEWFKKHPAAGRDARAASERFERFVCAQLFWDRAMAEAIAGARRDARRPLVVGIMGSGHVEYGDGVAHQLAALGVDDVATRCPGARMPRVPARIRASRTRSSAWRPAETRAPRPRIGVTVSAARAACGSRGGRPEHRRGDRPAGGRRDRECRRGRRPPAGRPGGHVRRQAPGTWLPLSVRRGEEEFEMVARFPAER